MIVNDALLQAGGSLIGGGVAGFAIGYALRKIIQLLLIALGAILLVFLYFQYQGYLSVRWEKISAAIQGALHMDSTQITGNGYGMINSVINSLGIPLTSGLAVGMIIGFMRAGK
jgi:uncharacterized membrane protein (Fun14 family)